MIFVDDFTRMMWVAFLKEKSLEKFKIFKNRVENESGFKIRNLRSDRWGEFTSREFNIYCEEHGIKRKLSSPYRPKENGIVERRNRSIAKVGRAMLFENDVPKTFWREALNTAVYTLNRVQLRKGMDKTPYDLWFGYYHQSNILEYLEANVTLKGMMTLASLTQEVIKVCFLDIHWREKNLDVLTIEQKL